MMDHTMYFQWRSSIALYSTPSPSSSDSEDEPLLQRRCRKEVCWGE